MLVDGKTRTHTIVDDLTALSRKPAGLVTPNPGARIPVRTAETCPGDSLPANGKSSSRPQVHSYGLGHRKSAIASNDRSIVDDLASTEPAGPVTSDSGARIPVRTAETWPVGPLPANGKSSSRPQIHSFGLERRKSAIASNDLSIVGDLASTEPAGPVTPDSGVRIPVRTVETWPADPLPANGKSSRRPERHSFGLEHRKNASMSNNRDVGARKFPRSPSLPGSGVLPPFLSRSSPATSENHLLPAALPAKASSAARRKQSVDHRLPGEAKRPRLSLGRDRRGPASLCSSSGFFSLCAAELLENRSQ